jgi:hypothetical protein
MSRQMAKILNLHHSINMRELDTISMKYKSHEGDAGTWP